MRRNKFTIAPPDLQYTSLQFELLKKKQKDQLTQNKIYFPGSKVAKLMPYAPSNVKASKRLDLRNTANTLYSITEKINHSSRSKCTTSFRINNNPSYLSIKQPNEQLVNNGNVQGLVKYNTVDLKSVPEIKYKSHEKSIPKSRNVYSLNKFVIEQKVQSPRKSSLNEKNKRNLSFYSLKKTKSNNQRFQKLKQRNFQLYQTYFSTKNTKKHLNSIIFQDQSKKYQNAEDILSKQIIYNEVYGKLQNDFQQQLDF